MSYRGEICRRITRVRKTHRRREDLKGDGSRGEGGGEGRRNAGRFCKLQIKTRQICTNTRAAWHYRFRASALPRSAHVANKIVDRIYIDLQFAKAQAHLTFEFQTHVYSTMTVYTAANGILKAWLAKFALLHLCVKQLTGHVQIY